MATRRLTSSSCSGSRGSTLAKPSLESGDLDVMFLRQSSKLSRRVYQARITAGGKRLQNVAPVFVKRAKTNKRIHTADNTTTTTACRPHVDTVPHIRPPDLTPIRGSPRRHKKAGFPCSRGRTANDSSGKYSSMGDGAQEKPFPFPFHSSRSFSASPNST